MYDTEKVILALEKDHVETIIGLLTDRLITAELCKDNAYREASELREERDHLVAEHKTREESVYREINELREERDRLVAEHTQMAREYVAMQNNLNALIDKLPDATEAEEVTIDE